ncbi:glutathione hydrolase-like YwrD proenzyme isoform X1, partial [Ixodes scapularis]
VLAQEGPAAFYEGPVAQAVVDAVSAVGGVLSLEDLKNHFQSSENPVVPTISTTYHGVRVHTMGPPSQGAILLEALNILEGYNLKSYDKTSGEYFHLLIEALRLAIADGLSCVSSPDQNSRKSLDRMTCKRHAEERRALIDKTR